MLLAYHSKRQLVAETPVGFFLLLLKVSTLHQEKKSTPTDRRLAFMLGLADKKLNLDLSSKNELIRIVH
jgi:hypothetical protein